MLTPISDVLDRYSILWLKKLHSPKDDDIAEEFELYRRDYEDYIMSDNCTDKIFFLLSKQLESLKNINGQIWKLESDIRKGKEKELGLEEVGRRALAIRDLNKKRIDVKNEIAKTTKTGFREIKLDHASR